MRTVWVESSSDTASATDELSVVLPAYNEQESLPGVVQDAVAACQELGINYEVVVIDDGSTDDTSGIALQLSRENPKVRVVRHPRNLGFSGAIRSALSAGRGQWVFLAPADGQFSFSALDDVLSLRHGADVVVAVRRSRAEGVFRALLSRAFHTLAKLLLGVPGKEFSFCLLVRRSCLDGVHLSAAARGAAALPELLAILQSRGARFAHVIVDHLPRKGGSARGAGLAVAWLTLLDLCRIALRQRLSGARNPGGAAASLMFVVAALGIALWGARVTWLEGVVYATAQGFRGDFFTAMFNPALWDGQGILYGPVFVIEYWFTHQWPQLLTIEFYGYLNLLVALVAFAASAVAVRARAVLLLIALAAWLGYSPLYYALSVAAHPEFLELALLGVAWLAASRRRVISEGVAIGVAAMTKLVPIMLILTLIIRQRWQGLLAATAASLLLMTVVGVGQRLSPVQTVLGTLLPFGNLDAGSAAAPYLTRQFLGVNSAIARLLGVTEPSDPLVGLVQMTTLVLVLVATALALHTIHVLAGPEARTDQTALALTYTQMFTLLPIVTLSAHGHTFIFLLPAWTGIAAALWSDKDTTRRLVVGSAVAVSYMLSGFPLMPRVVDRVLGTSLEASWASFEPIWAAVAMLLVVFAYVRSRYASSRQ